MSRKDCTNFGVDYKREGDARDARPTARRLKEITRKALPVDIRHDLITGVHLMALAAGIPLSSKAPLYTLYLAAAQRNSDWHGGHLPCTPEESSRIMALCRADIIVLNALAAFDAWKKSR